VQRIGDNALAGPGERGKLSRVVLAVAMPPDAGSDRAQTMSGMAASIVEEELLANRLFEETVSACSW
jgi:hypothetical protein